MCVCVFVRFVLFYYCRIQLPSCLHFDANSFLSTCVAYTCVWSVCGACVCSCACNCSHNTRWINKRWEFVELFTKCLWVRARDLKHWSQRTPRTPHSIRIHIYFAVTGVLCIRRLTPCRLWRYRIASVSCSKNRRRIFFAMNYARQQNLHILPSFARLFAQLVLVIGGFQPIS